jgi:hypothetical protein
MPKAAGARIYFPAAKAKIPAMTPTKITAI